mmetsp:Transcript_52325/g.136780  ORF Transcript_52325/g.136780 Transcript_52325/m.136780 type:complete len:383 (-) Transcript_52325:2148-3296(-)
MRPHGVPVQLLHDLPGPGVPHGLEVHEQRAVPLRHVVRGRALLLRAGPRLPGPRLEQPALPDHHHDGRRPLWRLRHHRVRHRRAVVHVHRHLGQYQVPRVQGRGVPGHAGGLLLGVRRLGQRHGRLPHPRHRQQRQPQPAQPHLQLGPYRRGGRRQQRHHRRVPGLHTLLALRRRVRGVALLRAVGVERPRNALEAARGVQGPRRQDHRVQELAAEHPVDPAHHRHAPRRGDERAAGPDHGLVALRRLLHRHHVDPPVRGLVPDRLLRLLLRRPRQRQRARGRQLPPPPPAPLAQQLRLHPRQATARHQPVAQLPHAAHALHHVLAKLLRVLRPAVVRVPGRGRRGQRQPRAGRVLLQHPGPGGAGQGHHGGGPGRQPRQGA